MTSPSRKETVARCRNARNRLLLEAFEKTFPEEIRHRETEWERAENAGEKIIERSQPLDPAVAAMGSKMNSTPALDRSEAKIADVFESR